jgi:hypothetical protein
MNVVWNDARLLAENELEGSIPPNIQDLVYLDIM